MLIQEVYTTSCNCRKVWKEWIEKIKKFLKIKQTQKQKVEQIWRTCNIMYIKLTWEKNRFNLVRYVYRMLEYFI